MTRVIVTIIIFIASFDAHSQRVTIQDAIDQNLVHCRINGSWDYNDTKKYQDANGQYFGKCITIRIKNKTSDIVSLRIDDGLLLMCEDTAVQNMLITQPLFVEIDPRRSQTYQLYAMCSEFHDGVPGTKKKYQIGEMADTNLVKIANSINQMFMQNIVGQGAVWAYTDKVDRSELKQYGATNASLKMTIEVLNKAGVFTKINPQVEEIIEEEIVVDEPQKSSNPKASTGILVQPIFIYIAGGLLLLLLISTGILMSKLRKKKNAENSRV